ncbi:MFS transporter [Tsukamurella sp. 8F]|uniref:MFS transporter n=1 Tax=unclassified Tsukamurella TaxID=2633480 RepID=UPI0023B9B985|nr:MULTISPECIES: MFS transporter [unclassified Tsukamurella]MDF0528799.1 MFS transporter [Tsukamurella sp. 8J]MDF0586634.1 MFS transporter [Tsukamurella sp. 8F]
MHGTVDREAEGTSLIGLAGPTYFPVAFMARLPYAMMVVGVLTLVVAGRGSLGFAGLSSACVGVGVAAFGPLLGAAADRFGQRRVVLVAGIVNGFALSALAWLVFSPLPGGAVLAGAFAVGASAPQVSPLSRSRLVGMIARGLPESRHARVTTGLMAYESAADEVIFVFGPVIVGLLATTLNPAAPMIGAAVLTALFVTAFALHPSAREVAEHEERAEQASKGELVRPGLLAVYTGVLGMGLFFGSALTGLTAFMQDLGHAERAGLFYGVMGVGSAACALATALVPARYPLAARWLVSAVTMLIGSAIVATASTLPVMLIGMLVAGVGVGPTLVTEFSLASARSPRGRASTVMTIAGSGIIVGQSAASAINGWLADSLGTAAAQCAPAVASAVILSAALWNRFLSRNAF